MTIGKMINGVDNPGGVKIQYLADFKLSISSNIDLNSNNCEKKNTIWKKKEKYGTSWLEENIENVNDLGSLKTLNSDRGLITVGLRAEVANYKCN